MIMAEQTITSPVTSPATSPCLATDVFSPTASSSRAGSNVARIQRNVAEKQRRDKLNGYINELANIVPMISRSARRLDKTSILRLSAAHLRICKSSLGANSKVKKTFTWCPNFLSNDQIREILESVDGFLIITASNGKILFTSRSVERYLGHQDIDMIGHSLYMFIHEKDVDDIKQKMKELLEECLEKGASRGSFACLMKEKAQPRSEVSTYQQVQFVGGMSAADDPDSEKPKSVITHMFKAFVKIVDISPYNQLSLEDATADEYVTRHSLDGTIIYADHRLATLTGHMPNEVVGLSAYKYIHESDVQIALFAQHLMFSSDKGTGVIVYRLQTRDNRFIYLKSVGCLQFDKSTLLVDHFVCINQQLSESDGDLQLKYFFDRYIPQVKGSTTDKLMQSVQALQLSKSHPMKSSPINHKKIVPVASKNLELSSPKSPGSSDSTVSSLSSDSSKSSEENSPDTMEHCNDSDIIAIQETSGHSPGSPDFVHHNNSASPSSVPSPDDFENKEKGFGTISIANDSECLIVTDNGPSSGLVNGSFTSSTNSPSNVNQNLSVDIPKKITSPPLHISKNYYSLTEGPTNHVHNNLRMVMGPVIFNSNGNTSPSESKDTTLPVDAQCEYVGTLSDSGLNKSEDRNSLLTTSHSPSCKCKNPVECGEKINGEMNMYGHHMNGKLSLSPNEISSEDSSSPLEIHFEDHEEDIDVFHEDMAESFTKHSSFIRNINGAGGLHSTLAVVNSCDSDSILKNSKWSVDSFSVFQSTVEENSTLSMDYCDTMPTTEDEVNGDLKNNISLQEDLSSLLSATLPHSDSNSLPSANGWNDILNPTEYSSPFSNETTLQKDEEQLLVSSSKVKSYDLCDKGTGVIVYRLQTRDNRFIYLKSVGCLQFDKSTLLVDHFVCINQQLSESDGDLQLKYFFDRYIPQVKGSTTDKLMQSVQALQLSKSHPMKSSPINHKKIVPVASKNLELSSPKSPGSSDSTVSSLSSDSSKSSEENSPDTMEHCNDSDIIAIQETSGHSPGSPDFVHHNNSASPSSVPSPDDFENKEKGFGTISIANDSECLIVTDNGPSSGLVNGSFTSSTNSPSNVNQNLSVDIPKKITSPPLHISKNYYSLTEGPTNHVHNNLRMVMGPVIFNSNGNTSPSESKDTTLPVDAQCEYVGTLSDSGLNKSEDRNSLLTTSHSPSCKCKNPVECGEKINGEMNMYGHHMNGKLSLSPNEISSEDSSSPLEIHFEDHEEDIDVFHEDMAESFTKHSSFIRNINGAGGLHSTLAVVNSCDSDSILKNSKWSVDSFSVFQSTVEENSTLSMDYCDTMPTTEDEVNGELKNNISLQEDLSSLLSATLPHSDSNSLPSANGWNDILNPTEYSSPFSNETTLQKDEEQLLVSSSKVKSYDLW